MLIIELIPYALLAVAVAAFVVVLRKDIRGH